MLGTELGVGVHDVVVLRILDPNIPRAGLLCHNLHFRFHSRIKTPTPSKAKPDTSNTSDDGTDTA